MMKYITKPVFSSFLIAVGIFSQSALMFSVDAEIFKCTSKQGKVFYNDKPCPVENDEKKIQNEKDPVNGYIPSVSGEKKEFSKKSFIKPDSKTTEVSPVKEQDTLNNIDLSGLPKKPPRNSRSSRGSSGTQGAGNSNNRRNLKIPATAKKILSSKLTVEEKKTILGIHRIPE